MECPLCPCTLSTVIQFPRNCLLGLNDEYISAFLFSLGPTPELQNHDVDNMDILNQIHTPNEGSTEIVVARRYSPSY